ncbi:MAG: hypothetical protein ACRCWS_05420 [Propionibacteriaceae bacterium]
MSEQLVIGFTPLPSARRVATWRGVMRTRILFAAIATVLALVLFFWQPERFSGSSWGLTILVLLIGLSWVSVLFTGAKFIVARRELARLGEGMALALNATGMNIGDSLGGGEYAWSAITSMVVRRSGLFLRPKLMIRAVPDRQIRIALSAIDALPADIDNAVRAYSRGQVQVQIRDFA